MMKTFKEQLGQLSKSSLRDLDISINKYARKNLSTKNLEKVKEFITFSPVLLERIYFHWAQEGNDNRISQTSEYLLNYLYQPIDKISTRDFGLFGFIDDAYLISVAYEHVLTELILKNQSLEMEDWQLLEHLSKLKPTIRNLIKEDAIEIEIKFESNLIEAGHSEESFRSPVAINKTA